jgi:hypothetical protein
MRKVVRKTTDRVRRRKAEGVNRQVQGRYKRMRKALRKTTGRVRRRKAEQVDRQGQENEKGSKENDR